MSEFIKIKNDTGDGEMLLKVERILKVSDKDGGAIVTYSLYGENSTSFKTASTAAEVLKAIEGAQDYVPIHRSPDGSGAYIQTSYNSISPIDPERPMSLDEYNKRKLQEVYAASIDKAQADGSYPPSPNLLALIELRKQLAGQLENHTGIRWDASPQLLENSTAFFRCVPAGSHQHFDTKTLCHVALEDESQEALEGMAYTLAVMVLASWRLRGL